MEVIRDYVKKSNSNVSRIKASSDESTLYRRLPPVIRDLRAEPTGLFKRFITTWLRMIGSDNAESLLTPTYRY
ncbi:hypothetical protein J6590_096580 [Homalodisca vitripennis]|nr:hypothetical protein J6590_096580 [Homalodisca vitripennis]